MPLPVLRGPPRPSRNRVNVSGLLCCVTQVQKIQKDVKPLKFKKAMLSDSDDIVPITSFRELVIQVGNNNTEIIIYRRSCFRIQIPKIIKKYSLNAKTTITQSKNDMLLVKAVW